jgi:hypothetical protein
MMCQAGVIYTLFFWNAINVIFDTVPKYTG